MNFTQFCIRLNTIADIRKTTAQLAMTLLAAVVMSGCASDLPEYAKLDTLRVLAMKADTPEVDDVAATVQITPYVSDTAGTGRILTYSYQTCIDPGISYGVQPACSSASSTPIEFGPVGLTRKTYTGAAPTLTISLPSGILASSKQAAVPNYFNGVAYLVIYKLSTQDQSSSVTAFKRILVSTNPVKNSNPTIATVTSNAVPLLLLPLTSPYPTAAKVDLNLTLSANSTESFQTQNSDGTYNNKTESPVATWFFTDGDMEYTRTVIGTNNPWTLPIPLPTTRSAVMVTVVRDERGGEDVQQIEFE